MPPFVVEFCVLFIYVVRLLPTSLSFFFFRSPSRLGKGVQLHP